MRGRVSDAKGRLLPMVSGRRRSPDRFSVVKLAAPSVGGGRFNVDVVRAGVGASADDGVLPAPSRSRASAGTRCAVRTGSLICIGALGQGVPVSAAGLFQSLVASGGSTSVMVEPGTNSSPSQRTNSVAKRLYVYLLPSARGAVSTTFSYTAKAFLICVNASNLPSA